MNIDDLRARWAALRPRTRRAVYVALGVVILLSLLSTCARAVEPGWYGPGDNTARGILIHCQPSGVCGFAWFDHADPPEQIWLIAAEPCQRGEPVCSVDLLQPAGPGFGAIFGEATLGEPVGFVSIEQRDGEILLDWEVRAVRRCQGFLGASQLWLNGCLRTNQVWTLRVGG